MKKISSAWTAIKLWIVKQLYRQFELFKEHGRTAVKVTSMLKLAVESPVGDIIVSLIPGDLDNQLYYRLQKIIPEVANKVAIASGIYEAAKNNNEAIAAIAEYMKGLVPEGRAKFYVEFAAQVNIALADGEISFPEAVALTQSLYIEIYGKK